VSFIKDKKEKEQLALLFENLLLDQCLQHE
jgi:hypothetical protein